MSDGQKQISCVVCKAYLFEEDDVVYCPVCGAPHHRECYHNIGHCGLEELHGTENEYNPNAVEKNATETQKNEEQTEYTICRICGERYSKDLNKCPHCSAPDFSGAMPIAHFDFLGGIPADYQIDENVTAEDARKFVVSNTHRYIPKFAKNRKVSWNWVAFLLPCCWMFSRKMYKNGIIAGLFTVISTLLTIPMTQVIYSMPQSLNYVETVEWLMTNLPEINIAILLTAFVGSSISTALQILSGLFGDYLYRNHVINSIKDIKENSEDMEHDFRKKGGVNMLFFFLSYFAVQYIPIIIATLL